MLGGGPSLHHGFQGLPIPTLGSPSTLTVYSFTQAFHWSPLVLGWAAARGIAPSTVLARTALSIKFYSWDVKAIYEKA